MIGSRLVALTVALLTTICTAAAEPNAELVKTFVEVFSKHDVTGMLALAHKDIEWLTIDGASVLVETQGQEALGASMERYFKSCPTCRSTVEVSSVNGNFVSAIETAQWETKGQKRSQASLSVYEIVGGKVRRVWYYPAIKN